jgi:hypothetical protein
MAMLPEGLNDEIDVYHAWKFTADEALWSVSDVGEAVSGLTKSQGVEGSGSIGGSTGVLFTSAGGVGSLKLRTVCRSVELRRQWA